jgi:putative ABC transport system ATP-binding protein
MESEKIIETVDLTKIYGEGDAQVIALDRVNISIHAGEFVAIMGPSGSGKSTLLNIIACMDRPSEGQYLLAGEDVSNYNRKELAMIRSRHLGFVFQSFNLLQRATALDNVILPLVYRRENRVSIAERHDLAMAALEQVGLTDRAHHMPNQLSGGQQQRVAIARALINQPTLLLGDEPTGNLDSKSSHEIMDIFENLHAQGRTVVIVTHEAEIAHHTQRVIQIRDGQVYLDSANGSTIHEASAIHAPTIPAVVQSPLTEA